ncbi:cyclic nucleotide-binding domain-containing protein [Xanthobacter oligotrophicus]|nr:cyclic nucleotide-binding domain-containing protein [Xanthobacter oligotrophicus]MCG5234827.1 cyclic nucleotide-binding domain-containing protein [Xanthobacter oligotrophicus]
MSLDYMIQYLDFTYLLLPIDIYQTVASIGSSAPIEARMRPEDAAAIRDLLLFRDAREDTFAELVRAGFLQRFPPGVTLINESEPADFLHVVVEGLVELFATSGDRETTMSIVEPVGTFILAAVLNDQVYLQSARTLEKAQILMIPAEKVREALGTDPAFTHAVVTELARGYRRAIKEVKNQKLRTGAERLANWLLRQAVPSDTEARVRLRFEKRVLSSLLGMTPENLSRALSALKPHGVVILGPEILIQD